MRLPAFVLVGLAVQAQAAEPPVRIGYFPNLTHASAILGLADGSLAKAAGGAKVETTLFNAGPSVIEAMFAGALDLSWVGPNPAINGYLKSKGEVLVVAGAAEGGAALIVRPASGIAKPADFRGKRVGTPQLGNTQDVACRAWLRANGLNPAQARGDVQVIPVANADQLDLFRKGSLDAIWAVEPWASRLVLEAGGKVLLDEREVWKSTGGKHVTATLVAARTFVETRRPLLVALLRAHVAKTRWMQKKPADALAALAPELARISGGSLPPAILARAWRNVRPTADPVRASFTRFAEWGFAEGFLGRVAPDLTRLCDLGPLNEALKLEGLPPVK